MKHLQSAFLLGGVDLHALIHRQLLERAFAESPALALENLTKLTISLRRELSIAIDLFVFAYAVTLIFVFKGDKLGLRILH